MAASTRAERRRFEEVRASLDAVSGGGRFDPAAVEDQPEPVRRFFTHAIAPGTELAAAVEIEQRARMRPRPGASHLDLHADEIIAPGVGFAWRATTRVGPVPMVILDRYLGGRGSVRGTVLGFVKVIGADDADTARSSRYRLAGESAWVPSALLPSAGVRWIAEDDATIRAFLPVDGEEIPVTLDVDGTGRVRRLTMDRYGNVGMDSFGLIPYGFEVLAERSFGGFTVMSRMRGGWWFGTDRYDPAGAGEFELVAADYR
jgi:hypothetical protein